MSVPYLLALRGHLVIKGKKPDGDSMRFVPADPEQLGRLERVGRIDVSADGSVQLRFEGIDTPETHYGTLAQPLGDHARDRLIELAGFRDVAFSENGTVTASTPDRVEATILSKRAEANGRPVAYVLPAGGEHPPDGDWVQVDEPLLRRTLNAAMLEDGSGYMTLYMSTPAEHARVFRELGDSARRNGRGVCGQDASRECTLADQDSIGPTGQLILPKLFRRCYGAGGSAQVQRERAATCRSGAVDSSRAPRGPSRQVRVRRAAARLTSVAVPGDDRATDSVRDR